jgi:glutathione S-transferase
MDYNPHVIGSPSSYTSTLNSLTTSSNIMTNEQKKDWFLRLDPNGRIPVLLDHTQSPPFPVMETSAELLYLLKFADKDDVFGFKDELERSQALQWLFFWV